MTGSDVFLVDTNILVYAHDKSHTQKHEISRNLIETRIEKKEKLAISSQNLSEFFYVTTRKGFLTKKEAIEIISDIIDFSGWIKLDFSHKTVLEASRISDEHDMIYWDSLLAATMKQNSILNLYTENTGDFKVPWLDAVNPFGRQKKDEKKVS